MPVFSEVIEGSCRLARQEADCGYPANVRFRTADKTLPGMIRSWRTRFDAYLRLPPSQENRLLTEAIHRFHAVIKSRRCHDKMPPARADRYRQNRQPLHNDCPISVWQWGVKDSGTYGTLASEIIWFACKTILARVDNIDSMVRFENGLHRSRLDVFADPQVYLEVRRWLNKDRKLWFFGLEVQPNIVLMYFGFVCCCLPTL